MIYPIPAYRRKLTGRIRGRRQAITGKIVMQVEERVERNTMLICPPPPWLRTSEETAKWKLDQWDQFVKAWEPCREEWRDATLMDLLDSTVYHHGRLS